ncbi:MAG: hypothetical protein LCH54_08655 [Bacteroidetes bacterium]|nr:hypothetical protein [Bacteroidota bacterium]MCA0446287.1 hypothetical protein [Bacteroidota bacterium]
MERKERRLSRKFNLSGFLQIQFFVLLFAITPVWGKSQFFLIQKPEKLEIRNQFEQKLTPSDFQLLKPYRPLKLISKSELLSDGVTKAMVVELAGKRFYFLLDGNKSPIRKRESGEWIQLDNLESGSGSGYVSRSTSLGSVSPNHKTDNPLPSGTVAEIIASQNGKVLVWIQSLNSTGWIPSKSLSSSSSKSSTENNAVQQAAPDSLQWVTEILSEANQILKSACNKSGQQIVQFSLIPQKGSYLIRVEGSTPDRFERSFESLSRKISLYATAKSVSVEQIESGLRLEWAK